jgi:hypothetical protein
VDQFEYVWPADDDGLWFFAVPDGTHAVVQVESSSRCCPFLVEGVRSRTGESVEQTVRYVLDELEAPSAAT